MDNSTILIITSLLLRIAFVVGAVILAKKDIDGWGWLVFGAIVCSISLPE